MSRRVLLPVGLVQIGFLSGSSSMVISSLAGFEEADLFDLAISRGGVFGEGRV